MTPLKKALPPKLAYRFKRWMMKFPSGRIELPKQSQQPEAKKSEMTMKKHEAAISFFKSDVVKMDFGPQVNPTTKKMALEWAKKRGLNVIESGLAKSANGFESYTFAKSQVNIGNLKLIQTILL